MCRLLNYFESQCIHKYPRKWCNEDELFTIVTTYLQVKYKSDISAEFNASLNEFCKRRVGLKRIVTPGVYSVYVHIYVLLFIL